jgi:hypothetical protein
VGSDRARISFDRTREYRSLVAQQGRVTLEADVNEQALIASEALRLETIDLIGLTGTPDDGYLVSIDANGDIIVGPGIMYVGGWRMRFTQPVPIDNQPEWIDQQLFTVEKRPQGDFVIALLVSEQEVQAVEDQALREVALGGPDTAARTRLMQHIVSVPTKDDTCAAVLKDWDSVLKPLGLALNPNTLALDFNAALEVSFYPPAGPADPCCPPAQGGYLGSDNQLVRVTVTDYDSKAHTGHLLWGWNNASFLYRAGLVDPTANPPVLTLSPAPVDSAHTPQLNQVVEILRSTMVLGNPADLNFIAAPEGDVITLASAGTVFDPTTNQLTLPTGTVLPGDYTSDTNPLFVRLWQAEVPFSDGVAQHLDKVSGLAVTIHMEALPTGPLEARPFWDFAVRPNTPQQVYPQRYLQNPQGPTGPRRWLTDLAIVDYVPGAPPTLVADCRVHFPTGSGDDDCGCCGITLTPAQVTARGGLQAVIDAQAKAGQTLSLRPGIYVLEAPLALTRAHTGFSFSGCESGRARLTIDPANNAAFTAGMITITETSNISISGLLFNMPLVPFTFNGTPIGNPTTGQQFASDLAIGISLNDSERITITDCEFLFPSVADSPNDPTIYLGAGIYAYEDCSGLRALRNRFLSAGGGQLTADTFRFLIGIWMTPDALNVQGSGGTVIQAMPAGATQTNAAKQSAKQVKAKATPKATAGFVNLPPVTDRLDDVEITDNRFTGLTLAVIVMAELGMIRCNSNRVANSSAGFWFLDSDLGANVAFGQAALAAEQQPAADNLADATSVRQFMQPVFLANALIFSAAIRSAAAAKSLTKPSASATPSVSNETLNVLTADYTTQGTAAFTTYMQSPTSTDPSQPTDPTQPTGADLKPPSETRNKKKGASKAAAPAAAAAPAISPTDYANASAAYTSLVNVGVSRELAGTTLIPAIYLRDNDVELVPWDTTADNPASLQGIYCMLSLKNSVATPGALFLSGNRVEVPNGYSMAVSATWAASAIITGNFFNQRGARKESPVLCVVVHSTDNFLSCLAGNIVNADWRVTPARFGIPAANDWRFLNTVL